MLEAVKPEAVCAFGSIYDHLGVVEACAPRQIQVMVEKPLAVSLEHAEKMAGLVRSLGMAYYAIPVVWSSPQSSDFTAFEQVMQQLPAGKTLLHCAANFRVTAFYSLYALKHLGWSPAQAEAFRAHIWEGSQIPVWEQLIGDLTKQISEQADPG
jgi:hypothetical protein